MTYGHLSLTVIQEIKGARDVYEDLSSVLKKEA